MNRSKFINKTTYLATIPLMFACAEDAELNTNGDGDIDVDDEVEVEKLTTPNILLVVTDQQSVNTISSLIDLHQDCYSSSPSVNRIVDNGITFTNCYCANSVSVPSRYSIFTGLFGGKAGVRDNEFELNDEAQTRATLLTNGMGNLFKKGGYDTYYAGKVHLPASSLDGDVQSLTMHPTSYGFDEYLSSNERLEMAEVAADFLTNRTVDENPFLLVTSFINPHDICSFETADPDKNTEATRMVATIREEIESYDMEYFYLTLAPKLPSNIEMTVDLPTNTKTYKRTMDSYTVYDWYDYRFVYKRLIDDVDSHIGVVLDALDANPELKANTIIVFTSDHGEMQGSHRLTAKSKPYEECQQVPLVFSGQAIGEGIRSDISVSGVDIVPTLCDLAGIDTSGVELDGESLRDVVYGVKDATIDRDYIYMEALTFRAIVKDGYKYTLFDNDPNVDDGDPFPEMLVDLNNDTGETVNILSSNPTIASELKALLPEI